MKKIYPLFGIMAPVIFILAVFIGGALRQDYSPFYNTISELSMTSAPNKLLMDFLFGTYNIFLLIFGLGAYLDNKVNYSRKYRASTIMLVVIAILGLLTTLIFSQDPRGSPVTLYGTLHIVLTGISSALIIISVLLAGLSLKQYAENKIFSYYSYFTAILIFISGGMAAVAVASNSTYGGLYERIPIFLFMIWIIIFSFTILRRSGK